MKELNYKVNYFLSFLLSKKVISHRYCIIFMNENFGIFKANVYPGLEGEIFILGKIVIATREVDEGALSLDIPW